MLVYAAHVPHTPLLIPTVGRENTEVLKKTNEALKIVAQELYAARPEVLIILAGHGNPSPEVFALNLSNTYQTNLSEFGDLTTKIDYSCELGCADRLQRFLRRSNMPFTLFSNSKIDYSTSVPLIKLTEKIKKFSVLPIFSAPKLSPKKHFEFGQLLKEIVSTTEKRVAVISAGDLSHALSSQAPAGLHPEGAEFDKSIRESLTSVAVSGLLQLSPELITKSSECAYQPVLMLLGLLEGTNVRSEELCYEFPFGVGYLTVQFHL